MGNNMGGTGDGGRLEPVGFYRCYSASYIFRYYSSSARQRTQILGESNKSTLSSWCLRENYPIEGVYFIIWILMKLIFVKNVIIAWTLLKRGNAWSQFCIGFCTIFVQNFEMSQTYQNVLLPRI